MVEQRANLSNPFSTGGGGYNFEIAVHTYFAMHIIMDERLSFFKNTKIVKMKLQGHYDGFNTDDCILYGEDKSKCLCQIKHTISVTEKNDVFHDVISDAWNDYCNREQFNHQTDQIVLIVSLLTNTDSVNTRAIIDWAHCCENETEFLQKISKSGFSSTEKQKKLSVIKSHLTSVKGESISDRELWDFLKHFSIQVLELDRVDSPLFMAISNLFAHSIGREGFESILYRYVAGYNQNAGTITREDLIHDLAIENDNISGSIVDKIEDHNTIVLESMHNTINGIRIDRSNYVAQIDESLQKNSIILISGERGVGKTGIVKSFIDLHDGDSLNIIFRAEELNKSSIHELFASLNWDFDTEALSQIGVGYQNRYIIIESLERILENEHTKAFVDLMSFVAKFTGWKLIASIRNYALNPVLMDFMAVNQLTVDIVAIEKLTDNQLKDFFSKCNSDIFTHISDEMAILFKTPIYLDYILRAVRVGYVLSTNDTYQSIKQAIWENVIENRAERLKGFPLKRNQVFISISLQRARQLKYEISSNSFDPEVLQKLENDGLISLHDGNVAITNDVLEDWALERWIEQCFNECCEDYRLFLQKIGYEQSICRAYRLWLLEKFSDDTFLLSFTKQLLAMSDDSEYSIWVDETIVAVLYSNKLKTILNTLRGFFVLQPQHLDKICFIIRVAAKKPDESFKNIVDSSRETEKSSFIQLKPSGSCWIDFISFLYEVKDQLPNQFWPHCNELLSEWVQGISIKQDTIPGAKEAGLLALHLLSIVRSNSYPDGNMIKSSLKVAVICYSAICDEFNALIESTIFNDDLSNNHGYIREMAEFILTDFSCYHIAKANPQILIRIAKKEWLINSQAKEIDSLYDDRLYDEQAYGLYRSYEYDYYPASGYREPFSSLFACNPLLAIDFVLDLCNTAVNSFLDYYLESKSNQEKQEILDNITCKITKGDGTTIEQVALPELWCAYRGVSTVPSILKCALMALENYLLKYFESFSDDKQELDSLVSYLLSKSNSVLITAVIVAVVTAHYKHIGEAALLLLQNKEFYEMDLERLVNEHNISFFSPRGWGKDIVFSNERKKSNGYPWRKESLETLCFKLQFTTLREAVLKIIDDIDSVHTKDSAWQFCKHRIDSREYVIQDGESENEVLLSSKPVEGDLKQIQDKQEERNAWLYRYSNMLKWSTDILNNVNDAQLPATVTECVEEIKQLLEHYYMASEDKLLEIYLQGINQAVAILLREHSNSMNDDELQWCIQYLLNSLEEYEQSLTKKWHKYPDLRGIRSLAKAFPMLIDKLPHEVFWNRLIELLTSYDIQLKMAIAKSISEFLWDIDLQLSKRCIAVICQYDILEKAHYASRSSYRIRNTKNDQQEISWLHSTRKKLSTVNEKPKSVFSIEALSMMLAMLPVDNRFYPETKSLFIECIDGICLVEQQLMKHNESNNMDLQMFYEVSSYSTERIGNLFYDLTDTQLTESKSIIEKIGLKAPHTCQWVMVKYRLLCEINHNYSHYWRFWKLLSGAAKQISIELNKGENYRFREERNMLIEYMYVNAMWQPADYINAPVDSGADYICEFAKQTIQNPIVYEGLASLMYNFPQAFLEKGIIAQADITSSDLVDNFRRSPNSVFYMENNLFAYITQLDTNMIPLQQFNSCRKILDALIQQSSSKAYYIRDYLLKSKKAT